MSVSWIEYKGVKVLYTDWRHKAPKQLKDLLLEYTDVFTNCDDPIIHRVSDFTGVPLSEGVVDIGKKLGQDIFSKKPGKSVVLGITGLRKFYYRLYKFSARYDIEIKTDLGAALEYIYQESKKPNSNS